MLGWIRKGQLLFEARSRYVFLHVQSIHQRPREEECEGLKWTVVCEAGTYLTAPCMKNYNQYRVGSDLSDAVISYYNV